MRHYIIAAAAAVAACGTALAEGYQVNTLSAKQLGMGHTGVALELGAESMFFNPAGMAWMDKTLDLSGSFTAIFPTSTATMPDGAKYSTDCNPSTPLNVNAAFSIYPNLKAGISLYTPYGSSINWTDNWPGAALTQNVGLKVFTVQPTVSWAITDRLSVGAGAMITWGTVDLNKGLIDAASFDAALPLLQQLDPRLAALQPFGNTTPASVNLNGKSNVAIGLNAGVMYKVTDRINVGASFRSRMAMKVDAGTASVTYANKGAELALGETLNLINQANFRAQMPCPWVTSLGVSYRPADRLTLALDARLTGWHTYKMLNVEFLADQLAAYNQHIEKRYRNAWCYSVGAQYAFTDRLDGRLGLMVDTTPVQKDCYNPETPGMTKVEPTAGLSFRPLPNLSIDVAFMYVHGCGADNRSCTYPDLMGASVTQKALATMVPAGYTPAAVLEKLNGMGIATQRTFTASYRLHALTPSIGISYCF